MAEVSFGEWLKRRRKGMGLTQQQLAARINYSTIALKKIEAEERRPSAQVIGRLAEIFKIPANEQMAFLRFARRDWKSTPSIESQDAPWRSPSASPRSNLPASLTSLIGRDDYIKSINFSPDGEHLASAGIDGKVIIWDLASGKAVFTLQGPGAQFYSVAYSPDGKRLAVSGISGIYFFDLPIDELVTLAKSHLTRALTTEECQQYLHVAACPTNP